MAPIYLVDTNIVAAYFKNDPDIVRRFRQVDLYIPLPVVGELHAWAFVPPRRRARLQAVRMLLSCALVLQPNLVTAERYGLLYTDLVGRGLMIPVNDIWIAALALQYDYTVATRDSDYDRITGLKVEFW